MTHKTKRYGSPYQPGVEIPVRANGGSLTPERSRAIAYAAVLEMLG